MYLQVKKVEADFLLMPPMQNLPPGIFVTLSPPGKGKMLIYPRQDIFQRLNPFTLAGKGKKLLWYYIITSCIKRKEPQLIREIHILL